MSLYKKTLLYTGLLFTSLGASQLCYAQVIVSDAILEFKNTDRLIRSIAVGNSSNDKNLFITAKITEVLNPASQNTQHVTTETVFTVPETFNLAPRTQRAIRIVSNKRPDDTERVFRIVFEPKALQKETSSPSGINMLTTTGVMMILNPPNAKEDLVWERKDGYINFTNNGNTNVVLRRDGFCSKKIKCTIKGQRLWSGDKWKLKLPEALAEEDISLEMRSLGELKEIVIPYEE